MEIQIHINTRIQCRRISRINPYIAIMEVTDEKSIVGRLNQLHLQANLSTEHQLNIGCKSLRSFSKIRRHSLSFNHIRKKNIYIHACTYLIWQSFCFLLSLSFLTLSLVMILLILRAIAITWLNWFVFSYFSSSFLYLKHLEKGSLYDWNWSIINTSC